MSGGVSGGVCECVWSPCVSGLCVSDCAAIAIGQTPFCRHPIG